MTGTDLIYLLLYLSVLFIAFCYINVIVHELAINRKELGWFSICVLISVEVFRIHVGICTNVSVKRPCCTTFYVKRYFEM